MAHVDDRSGSPQRCVVSCRRGDPWERMFRLTNGGGDAVAAGFNSDWGEDWALHYTANLVAHGLTTDEWIVIHGPDGEDDLGATQRREIQVIRDFMEEPPYNRKRLVFMSSSVG
eukprot:TRINITY_DN27893_c0_g1_i1.p1 TRINITY_DN27893_c0_g1~~TRINITY_DN27893_c0_g1_i1.p1  ORF type:complete len:114 (+),score=16.29 TRINITY_DN27893_c0_g1_i1:92-433(+)